MQLLPFVMRPVKKIILLIVLISVSVFIIAMVRDSAATGLRILNSAVALTSSYNVTKDIAYSDSAHQTLDIYTPENLSKKRPVVVFFYGGGWSWGDKSYFTFIADAFVKMGYVVVIPNYILYPNGKYPDFIDDGAKAVDWVSRHIHDYYGDNTQLNLVGHSAGAYIGAMVSFNDKYLRVLGSNTGIITKFAGVAGPYNFTPTDKEYIDIFRQENFVEMKVENHVSGNEPASLLLHSEGDTTVGQFNQEKMKRALTAKKSSVETILYGNDITHIKIMLKLHPWFAGDVNVGKDIDAFFKGS